MRFVGLHVDGQGGGTATLVEVGPTTLGVNGNIDFERTVLLNPPAGSAAIHFTAVDLPHSPFGIRLQGASAARLQTARESSSMRDAVCLSI